MSLRQSKATARVCAEMSEGNQTELDNLRRDGCRKHSCFLSRTTILLSVVLRYMSMKRTTGSRRLYGLGRRLICGRLCEVSLELLFGETCLVLIESASIMDHSQANYLRDLLKGKIFPVLYSVSLSRLYVENACCSLPVLLTFYR